MFLSIVWFLLAAHLPVSSCYVLTNPRRTLPFRVSAVNGSRHLTSSSLHSLKPAAMPLMDAGKALARSGELIIDLTTALDLYGGALSAAGAQIRNAGDCVAQAAASCRFKTGTELVTDELREAATCLKEAVVKLNLAVEEAQVDDDRDMAKRIEPTVDVVDACSVALESAGAAILQRRPIRTVGEQFVQAGEQLEQLSKLFGTLNKDVNSQNAAQRCLFASEQITMAGQNLLPPDKNKPKPAGKSWLKGGL